MIIPTQTPASIATPPAGTVVLFYDSTNQNKLSYMDSTRAVVVLENIIVKEDGCCSCEIQKKFWSSVTCALNTGILTQAQFSTIVSAGFKVISSEIKDALGNKVCTVTSGVITVPVATVIVTPNPSVVAVGFTVQLTATISPTNASNKNVIWISSNTAKATVDQNGLVRGIAVGTATIYAYSQSDPDKFGTSELTVS